MTFDDTGAEVSIDGSWTQGRATFGGVVAAIGNHAMRKLVPADRPLRSLQTTFVGPASAPGRWRMDTRILRVGKAVTSVHCQIVDEGQVAAVLVGVYGAPRESVVDVRPTPLTAARPVETLNEVRNTPAMLQFLQYFAIRWSEGAPPYTAAPRTPTKAFIHHRDPAPTSESHVIALIDCIPTPALSMFKAPAPASSLVWTLEFFEHRFDYPHDAWWRIDTDIEAAGEGYVHQTGVLNNPDGRPIALSRQLFAVFG
jgi:acyl-CoA thioesterase